MLVRDRVGKALGLANRMHISVPCSALDRSMQEGSYRGTGFGRGLAFYEKDGRPESRSRDSGEVSLTKGNQGVSKATERPPVEERM